MKKRRMIALISSIIKEIDYASTITLNSLNLTKMESVYLITIYNFPGISQYDIAKMNNCDKSLVVKRVSNLEIKGFITKKDISLRKKGVFLTPCGEKAVDFINLSVENFEDEVFSEIGAEKVEVFLNVLEKLKSKLEVHNKRNHFSYNFNKEK